MANVLFLSFMTDRASPGSTLSAMSENLCQRLDGGDKARAAAAAAFGQHRPPLPPGFDAAKLEDIYAQKRELAAEIGALRSRKAQELADLKQVMEQHRVYKKELEETRQYLEKQKRLAAAVAPPPAYPKTPPMVGSHLMQQQQQQQQHQHSQHHALQQHSAQPMVSNRHHGQQSQQQPSPQAARSFSSRPA